MTLIYRNNNTVAAPLSLHYITTTRENVAQSLNLFIEIPSANIR